MYIYFSPQRYLSVWILLVFVTSFVVSNTIKGTIPAFILSIISFPLVLLISKKRRWIYLCLFSFLFFLYILLEVISQLTLLVVEVPNFSDLILVSNDVRIFIRSSLITQTLYLICSLLLLVYVIVFYDKQRHEKYLSLSLTIFVSIGVFFWIFYMLFGYNGDFISNREYSDGLINPGQFQSVLLGNVWVTRFVSLTGEPSMYVYSVLPYFIYMNHSEYKKTALYILVSLVLTLSGTFITGVLFYGISLFIFSFKKKLLLYSIVFLIVISLLSIVSSAFREIIYDALLSKLLQESDSGLDRFISMYKHLLYFVNLPLPLMMFGMGFGFIRSPDMFSTLLVNTGLIGFLLFSTLWLYPMFALDGLSRSNIGLKCGLFTTYFIMMISVSEYSYPSLWLFVGIAYSNTPLTRRLLFSYIAGVEKITTLPMVTSDH